MDLQHMLHQKPKFVKIQGLFVLNFVDAYEITNGFKTTLERGYLNGDISDVREIASRTDGLITFLFIRRKTSVKLK